MKTELVYNNYVSDWFVFFRYVENLICHKKKLISYLSEELVTDGARGGASWSQSTIRMGKWARVGKGMVSSATPGGFRYIVSICGWCQSFQVDVSGAPCWMLLVVMTTIQRPGYNWIDKLIFGNKMFKN